MSLGPYKWPQGRVLRYIAGAVCLSYVTFGAYRFYVWQVDSPLPFVPVDAMPEALNTGVVGSVLLAVAGALGVYFLVFVNAKVSDYLIQVEGEMRKVYWPNLKPWFAWSSELWGSTYVVIIVVIILSVFIRLVDTCFAPLSKLIFN